MQLTVALVQKIVNVREKALKRKSGNKDLGYDWLSDDSQMTLKNSARDTVKSLVKTQTDAPDVKSTPCVTTRRRRADKHINFVSHEVMKINAWSGTIEFIFLMKGYQGYLVIIYKICQLCLLETGAKSDI